MNSIDRLIKTHRRASGLSQSELAKLAGVGKTAVFDLEHGKQSIRYDTVMKILSVLNIQMYFESPLMARLESQSATPEKSSK